MDMNELLTTVRDYLAGINHYSTCLDNPAIAFNNDSGQWSLVDESYVHLSDRMSFRSFEEFWEHFEEFWYHGFAMSSKKINKLKESYFQKVKQEWPLF